VRTASHLAHKPLLLHLAAELTQGLLELLGILDDYSHNLSRIQATRGGRAVNAYSRTSGASVRYSAIAANPAAKTAITIAACVTSTDASGWANAGRVT